MLEYKDDAEQQKALLQAAPWHKESKYFRYAHISSLALVKMATHANKGGSQEVMGVMTGKIVRDRFVVLDAYALPVEATETRVNAMGEGYEYMVRYLEGLQSAGRSENIVGWYHSHPGYGCWLSKIDIDTQAQNQRFQDPFLAVVIDPVRTLAKESVDIGAFRTLPTKPGQGPNQPESGIDHEFGLYADMYYSLEVSYFQSPLEAPLFDVIWNEYWTFEEPQSAEQRGHATVEVLQLASAVSKMAHGTRKSIEGRRASVGHSFEPADSGRRRSTVEPDPPSSQALLNVCSPRARELVKQYL